MLRTRLIVGAILIALTAGMLFVDDRLSPWFPFLFATVLLLSILGTVELVGLLPQAKRPSLSFCVAAVLLLVAANWSPLTRDRAGFGYEPWLAAWPAICQGFAALLLYAFLLEMARFKEPGGAIERLALAIWVVAYLGLLPCFLVQLRFVPVEARPQPFPRFPHGPRPDTVALALAIFVPKACDIGAYFTGRFLGRHHMTPVLSPKKTWEGAIGGLVLAVGASFVLDAIDPIIPGGPAGVVAFGLTVGIAGMLGDLAESLIKRDCERKDASQMVPGFGGILDVVDSILFAAPVAYWWLS